MTLWKSYILIGERTPSRIPDLDHKMEGIEQIRLRAKRSLLSSIKKFS